MNDRFRFRAWNKEEKKMYYDAQNTYDYMAGKPIIFAESFSCLLTDDEEWEVEQCTGLKDKNGNLIYEGDIVKIGNGSVNGEVIESDLVVEWICKNGRYNLPTWTSDVPDWSHYVEIIGNIHEQPEQKDKQ